MLTDVGGVGQTTTFTYDPNGNNLTITDALLNETIRTFDQLNRLSTSTDANTGVTQFTYDAHDRILTAEDPDTNTTSYVYDGFGNAIQQASPDSNTSVYYYDADNNQTKKVDALSITTTHSYDALDRVLTTQYPAESSLNVAYTYDQTGTGYGFGIGHLTSLTDAAGSLTRSYDERGNMLTNKRTNGSNVYTTTYTFDPASRIASIDRRLHASALGLVLEELGGVFFRLAADLADHDDRLSLGISEEQLERVDEIHALDRIAADADRGGLAEADLRCLKHRFVCKSPGARHNADAAALENIARHDANFALASGHYAWAVGANQDRLRARKRAFHPHHVDHRYAFGDADNQRDFRGDRLADRIRGAGRRHIDHGSVGAGLFFRFGDSVEDRPAQVRLAALAWRSAADDLGSVSDRLLRMEGAILAGKALGNDFGVRVDENRHLRFAPQQMTCLFGAIHLLSRAFANRAACGAPRPSLPRSRSSAPRRRGRRRQ